MAVSKDTLRTDVWDTVYTYIKTTNAISTDHIYSSLNSKLVSSVGYPFVILYPPLPEIGKVTIGGDIISAEVSMLIEVYHTSSESVKSIADSVTSKLLAGRDVFAGNRLCNMELDGGDYDTWQEGDRKIHRISFNVTYRYIST